jgi:predicted DsbA family dithiol-disulfide isomerase
MGGLEEVARRIARPRPLAISAPCGRSASVASLEIHIWSDIACPWCYVGKRRLEAALSRFQQRASVRISWHAFELDPSAPRVRDTNASYAERLAKKYGTSSAEAETMIHRMTRIAAGDGLDFRFDRIRPGNTFDAHRVLHLAGERGVQDAVKERFLRGYMTEGEPIGEPAALARMASEAGLDAAEVADLLASDLYGSEVRADEARARSLEITGVPFFVIGRYAVAGAQSSDLLLRVVEKAWSETAPATVFGEGAACGPDGCA